MKAKVNAVSPLKGLKAEAGVALAKDVNAPVQDVTVVKTIDHLNDASNDKSWQGYMVRFDNTSSGVPKVVPISAGRLKAIEEEKNIEVFNETADGFELINFRMGIEEGEIVFEK